MENIIVIVILVAIVGSAVAYLIKAKKSGAKCIGCPAGGSCGGSKMPKKKLQGRVIGKKIMKISGMHCEHCVMNVTKLLNQIDGVRADVSLSQGSAVISYDREIEDRVLKGAVEKLGYRVTAIEQKR